MSRRILFALAAVLAATAGCGKHDSGASTADGAGVQALPVMQPASGGEMVLIPAGTFTMGDSAGRPDETPHAVSIHALYVDKFPVTQEVYEKVMGVNPSKRKDSKNPVERTQWTDAVRFCNRCSEMEGLTPCYDLDSWQCNFDADGYRLPTEAEWEYACRAGASRKYCFGDAEAELPQYAWFKPHSQGKPRPVGQKLPNRWGLFDVHGNVWQWCNDWYGEAYYAASPADDPRGPATGTMRVLRGGAWDCTAEKCRSAYRHKEFPVYSDACFGADSYGFRRARKADAIASTTVVAAGPKSMTTPAPANKAEKKAEKVAPSVAAASRPGKIELAALKGTMVFVSDRGGTLKIWKMHASGKNSVQITRGTDPDADPRFSPDGKQILYTTLRGGFPEIWAMSRDGSAAHSVTKGSQANWAPVGKSMIFIHDNQTYIRDLDSGKETRVTPKGWERCGVPAFSPDGRHFAVASRHLGEIGIFILSLDGKANNRLPAAEACCTPQWSRDGKAILCQTVQGHICHVGVDGKNWEQVTFGADVQHDARYSPDGTMILFCRAPAAEGPWQICIKKLDDDEEFMQITKDGSNLLPDWHPDE
jgi:formylglycine-generating enzyme required for sulfatase activity